MLKERGIQPIVQSNGVSKPTKLITVPYVKYEKHASYKLSLRIVSEVESLYGTDSP